MGVMTTMDENANGHIQIVGDDDDEEFETPEEIAHAIARVYKALIREEISPDTALALARSVAPMVGYEVVKGKDNTSDWYMTDQREYVNHEARKESQDD